MSVKPSDVARPRDDSTLGTVRRLAVWGLLALGAWMTMVGGAQLACLLGGAPRPGWGLRAALTQLAHMAGPGAPPGAPAATAAGLTAAGLVSCAVLSGAWEALLKITGLRESDRREAGQLDGARWADAQDLTELLVPAGSQAGRLVLGHPDGTRSHGGRGRGRGELIAVQRGHSALVVAPTGQGKTESVMVPAILDWDGPVIVVSIKRDVYDLTAGYRATVGETRVLDPAGLTDPAQVRNAYWTPLAEARSWRAARMLADQMAGVGRKGAQSTGNEDYFAKASGELLAGLFFAAAHSPVPTMRTVSDWLADPEGALGTIEALLGSVNADQGLADEVRFNAPHALRSIRLRMIGRDPRTVEPIRATAANIIRAFDDFRLADIAPGDPGVLAPDWLWSPPAAWERPGQQRTLYVICPDAEQGTYEGLIVGAITQAYNAYGRAGQEGRPPDSRLLLVLDEVANTCPVPKLDSWVTAARGLGIQLVLATQNLAQLDTVWGREKAETIASAPRVRMFGPGLADGQTLSYIERISGQTGVVSETQSRSPYGLQLATSRQTQTQWRPLIQQQAAREIAAHTGLVFSGSLPPFTVKWRSAHTDPELRRRQKLAPVAPGKEELAHLRTPKEHRLLLIPAELTATPGALDSEDLDAFGADSPPAPEDPDPYL